MFTRRIQKTEAGDPWIEIPWTLLAQLGWDENTKVTVTVVGRTVVLTRVDK